MRENHILAARGQNPDHSGGRARSAANAQPLEWSSLRRSHDGSDFGPGNA